MPLEHAWQPRNRLANSHPSPVLIVDDERIIRELLRDVLEEEGFVVLTAANGREALQVIERTPIALVLTDLMMPEVSGMELARQLHTNPITATIPIMLMSAVPPDQIDDLFVVVLHKPFLIDTVIMNVGQWAQRSTT